MKQTPCEYMKWRGLPAIRKEIARSLTNDFGLSQRAAAKKLGVTPSAISQYLSEKRGRISIDDEEIKNEIVISAQRIIQEEEAILSETCRICQILRVKWHYLREDDGGPE